MKDLVENRRLVSVKQKLRLTWLIVRENGLGWCFLFVIYYFASALADLTSRRMNASRLKRGLPGLNSLALNKAIWEAWDWQTGGEEWNASPQWKRAVVGGLMDRFLPSGGTLLEIGPGGGRWTEWLLRRANTYIGVDVSTTAIDTCRRRFADFANARFQVGSGNGLEGVEDQSVDGIWSFDVFVHINEREVAQYLREFRRVMKKNAIAVIHHGAVGGTLGGWRSDLSQHAMMRLLGEHGLEVISSSREWVHDGETYRLDTYNDMITVLRRPLTA